jgi:hypothetical protein
VAGDTLLLNPANNGGNTFAPATVSKTLTIRGENGAAVVGPNWFIGPATGSVAIEDLEVSGATGNNGIVVNGAETVAVLDNVTVQNKPNFGVNINAGTVQIINGSRFLNNGGAGVSMGGAADVTIQGTAEEPILIEGNGFAQPADVQRAGLSSRGLLAPAERNWLVEHAVISGSTFGYVNQFTNTVVEDVLLRNVTISDVSQSALQVNGANVTVTYEGGIISGRTTPFASAQQEIDFPLIHMKGDDSLGNTFTGSGLTFPGGDYGMRLRNDSGAMSIVDCTIIGGQGGLSGIFAGGGGVELVSCALESQNAPFMIGVGGTAPITLTDPVFNGPAQPVAFWLQGHVGEFTIEGTDPQNKVDLDMAGVALLIRNWAGTATLRNVTATTNGGLFDCFGMGALAGSVVLNIEQSIFHGPGGLVTMVASDVSQEEVTINATNSIWTGTYSPAPYVLSVNDPQRFIPGTVNLVHSTIAPEQTAAVLINAQPSNNDVITSDSSIFDASGAGVLVASTVELQGQRNLSYSTGGATANGGWVGGFPGDTIIADPQLDAMGELTSGSPAIDAAGGSTMLVDYRGTSRPQGGSPDIGAHEFIEPIVIPAFEGIRIF